MKSRQQIQSQIIQIEATLQSIEVDYENALADIEARGVSVLRTISTPKGATFEKLGPNLSCSVVRTCTSMRRYLNKHLADLKAQLLESNKQENSWEKLRAQTAKAST